MKKKLLFVMPSLDAGGAEKSLVNLLGVIDTERFEIDVVLFHKTGIFLNMLPNTVNVTEVGGAYRLFSKSLFTSVLRLVLRADFRTAINRGIFAFKNKTIKNRAQAEQQTWKYVATSIKTLEKRYDVAIGFLEKSSIYFTADKVVADKKIGWIHTNYANSGMEAAFDRNYFKIFDYLVTVSEECAASLELAFPALKENIKVIHNIVSQNTIGKLAETGAAIELSSSKINILSIGRLSPEKGFDLAIDACAVLAQKGIDLDWFVIGDGKERKALEHKIQEENLKGKLHLLGAKANPYGYLKRADIYVQPSRYEGKSIAIDEAKMMRKPIVVTDFATVKDQILNGENGLVAEMAGESIAAAILQLLKHDDLKKQLVSNLQKEDLGTESEIEKLYRLIENP